MLDGMSGAGPMNKSSHRIPRFAEEINVARLDRNTAEAIGSEPSARTLNDNNARPVGSTPIGYGRCVANSSR